MTQDFEHDVAAGRIAGSVLLVGMVLVMLLLVFWAPDGVFFPAWLQLLCLALLMLLPAQWVVNRPWTIVAETHEPLGTEGEYWVGSVRGVMAARYETSRAAQNLEDYSTPDDGRGTLQLAV